MKLKSYIFIIVLIIILTFILGVRYGQRIEKNNKVVDYLLKITPTKPIPSPTPVKYIDYKSKKWGLKLTYPAGLEIKEEATSSTVLLKYPKN